MTTDAQRLTMNALDVQTDLFRFFCRGELGQRFIDSLMTQAIPDADVVEYGRDIAEGSLTAPVYAVTSDIMDLISSAAVSLPTFEMQPSDLPTPHGFVWFETPMVIKDRRGEDVVFRGFSWVQSNFVSVNDDGTTDDESVYGQGVFFLGYTDPTDARDFLHDEITLNMEIGSPHHILPIISGVYAYEHPDWLGEVRGLDLVMWFMAFTRFVGEMWVDKRSFAQPRHVIKRNKRVTSRIDEPSVWIVQLRRRAQTHREGDGNGPIEYSHRWLVRGHWRNQWYPSMQTHRPKWIPEHIKGPDDKPLIVRDKVFSVSR